MTALKRRQHRGITLLEVLATMAILLMGVGAAMLVVTQTSYSNRRSLSATQAQLIAEQAMENITLLGCSVQPPCGNLEGLDESYVLFQTSAGALSNVRPADPTVIAREYQVVVDVDVPSILSTIEPGSLVPEELQRDLVPGVPDTAGNIANVRVVVSWQEQERSDRQVVVLQTRMAP
ncbi:type 4 pilus biogenesis operon protein [Myxococcus xanthus DK 1622]|uniref:Type 4 pilus biogenesis operon protein n=1 Tax=Myxococcus xanthus (strain DK1622) TaxID=246197 RepID=Q1DFD8_MYXXD|nr:MULTISPECIES: prepilin-type N-terminal cleavage/methylation domain-containing protein [Myxococcus]ABF92453.1 type 4 pilus biogenesis operon protein [Myxococcus xanthus DK 1622]NOJ53088.1 prepilin-type N-terminal cleavage/methylation domain-containing protein [Myxococcus xanthus]QPM80079.1 prepilin-type N-terminal cleavage/methylation domain-containing protein [Myxococcus xanthus]QVW69143.1 prepilin-type N-terminal cleavage/methylation domain-containing protein [Myxococcus xanthus DZ2]QZZ479